MYSGSSCKQTSTTQESVGYLREWFPYAGTRGVRVKWPLVVDCLAIKKNIRNEKSCFLVFGYIVVATTF